MKAFDERYFNHLSDYPKAILKGRKPFHNRFWISYIRKLQPDGRLLDLGCGKGFFLEHAQKYYETYGVDISEYAIYKARERCSESKLLVENAINTNFDDRQFDIIVCFDILEHIDEPILVIRECNRMLKHEGLLIITVPNMRSLGRFWKQENWFGYRDQTHSSLLSKRAWVEMLRDAGFKIIDIFYDGLWDSPYFSKIPSILQHFLFKFPSTLLFTLGIPFPERFGENICITSMKKLQTPAHSHNE